MHTILLLYRYKLKRNFSNLQWVQLLCIWSHDPKKCYPCSLHVKNSVELFKDLLLLPECSLHCSVRAHPSNNQCVVCFSLPWIEIFYLYNVFYVFALPIFSQYIIVKFIWSRPTYKNLISLLNGPSWNKHSNSAYFWFIKWCICWLQYRNIYICRLYL